MREIIFRATRHEPTGAIKQIEGSFIDDLKGTFIRRNGIDFPINAIIVEQYTGLLDSRGKKIFEGDVIIAQYRPGIRVPYFVEWDERHALFTARQIPRERHPGLYEKAIPSDLALEPHGPLYTLFEDKAIERITLHEAPVANYDRLTTDLRQEFYRDDHQQK